MESESPARPVWLGRYELGSLRVGPSLAVSEHELTYTYRNDAYWLGIPSRYPIVRATSDRIEIDLGADRPELPGLARAYVFVNWVGNQYLVPAESMQAFCFFSNDRSQAGLAFSPFPMRHSPLAFTLHTREPAQPPIVPEEYRRFVLPGVVDTVVLDAVVGESAGREPGDLAWAQASVRVAAGSESGLLPGMKLFLMEPEGWGVGTILEVEASTSRAEFMRILSASDRARGLLPAIAPGSRVSTTARKSR